MKKKIFTSLFIAMSVVLFGQDSLKPGMGPHDGKVKKAGKYYIEVLDSPGNIYAFLLTADLKPISNKSVTGQMTLYFENDVSIDYPFRPYGTDGFFAEVPNGFYSCKVTFNVANKKVFAQFDNNTEIVKKK